MQLGILTKVYTRPTIDAVFDAVAEAGLQCVQLNLESAGLPPMPDELSPGLCEQIRRIAATRAITIASVQGTFNMCHPDADFRADGLRRLEKMTAWCAKLQTKIIAICTGTRDRDNMWRHHPDNRSPQAWDDMLSCIHTAVKFAESAAVTLAFEPEVNNVVDSAESARRLLDEIGSPRLKVTMDAANLFHAGDLKRMAEVLDEAFALLGKEIIIAHAKDLSHDGDAGHEPAGHGKLDYDRYMSLLRACRFNGPLLLHGLGEELVPRCVGFLKSKL